MSSVILQLPMIPGGPEVLLLLLLAVLLFGANKIPKLARSSGQAIGEFQKGREQVEQELEEMKGGAEEADAETETESTAAETEPTQTEPTAERSTDTSEN